jgi:hypothetical protein
VVQLHVRISVPQCRVIATSLMPGASWIVEIIWILYLLACGPIAVFVFASFQLMTSGIESCKTNVCLKAFWNILPSLLPDKMVLCIIWGIPVLWISDLGEHMVTFYNIVQTMFWCADSRIWFAHCRSWNRTKGMLHCTFMTKMATVEQVYVGLWCWLKLICTFPVSFYYFHSFLLVAG